MRVLTEDWGVKEEVGANGLIRWITGWFQVVKVSQHVPYIFSLPSAAFVVVWGVVADSWFAGYSRLASTSARVVPETADLNFASPFPTPPSQANCGFATEHLPAEILEVRSRQTPFTSSV